MSDKRLANVFLAGDSIDKVTRRTFYLSVYLCWWISISFDKRLENVFPVRDSSDKVMRRAVE